MHLFELAFLDMGAAAEPRWFRRRACSAVERGEAPLGLGDHDVVAFGREESVQEPRDVRVVVDDKQFEEGR